MFSRLTPNTEHDSVLSVAIQQQQRLFKRQKAIFLSLIFYSNGQNTWQEMTWFFSDLLIHVCEREKRTRSYCNCSTPVQTATSGRKTVGIRPLFIERLNYGQPQHTLGTLLQRPSWPYWHGYSLLPHRTDSHPSCCPHRISLNFQSLYSEQPGRQIKKLLRSWILTLYQIHC